MDGPPAPVQPSLLSVIVSKTKIKEKDAPKDAVLLKYSNGNEYKGTVIMMLNKYNAICVWVYK